MPRTTLDIAYHLPADGSLKETTISTGQLVVDEAWSDTIYSHAEQRVTVNTPGFRQFRKSRGGSREDLPINPFSYSKTTWNYPYGQVHGFWPVIDRDSLESGGISWTVDLTPDALSDSKIAQCDQESSVKARLTVKSSKVNLGIAFAERRQTSSLILSTANRIGGALTQLKRGNFYAAARNLNLSVTKGRPLPKKSWDNSKVLANEWLALQYGWRPLVNDVYGAAEALARERERPSRTRVVSSQTVTGVTNRQDTWKGVNTRRSCFGTYTRKYVFVFRVSHEGIQSLTELGITNPAHVLWDKLPWSFVLDWFVPVGQFIDSLDATLGLTFEKGSSTSFKREWIRYKANGVGQYLGGTTSMSASAGFTRVECVRAVLNSFPSANLPAFDLHITPTRGASTIALIRQRLLKTN